MKTREELMSQIIDLERQCLALFGLSSVAVADGYVFDREINKNTDNIQANLVREHFEGPKAYIKIVRQEEQGAIR